MKLLTVAIPCYNSQDYMEHAVETALVGGEDVEIILVNDGSSDKTAEIADRLQKEHPTIVRAIHQENGGHGAAVNTGSLPMQVVCITRCSTVMTGLTEGHSLRFWMCFAVLWKMVPAWICCLLIMFTKSQAFTNTK